jgi:transketolase N-terminal domain/subunit
MEGTMTESELLKFALEIRMEIVKAIGKKGGGHIGGSLSIIRIGGQ